MHVSIIAINILNFNTYFIRKICYYSHCTDRETQAQKGRVTSLCLHNGEDLARQSAVSQCFLKGFNKFWFLIILFNDIISFCLFKICSGYFIVVINSIICFLVFLKIKASQNNDMGKLELLCVLFTCAKEEYLFPHVDRVIFFYVKRVRSGVLGHFDLSFIFPYKGHTDGASGCRARWPFISLFLSAHLDPILQLMPGQENRTSHLSWELLKILYSLINIPF